MPANDEFPRGGTIHAGSAGAPAATITLPACPGIAHVIDSIFATTGQSSNVVGAVAIQVVSTSLGTIQVGWLPGSAANAAPSIFDKTNVSYVGAPGEAVTINFASYVGGVIYMLDVAWHDI